MAKYPAHKISSSATIQIAFSNPIFAMGMMTVVMDPTRELNTLAFHHHSDALMVNGNVQELVTDALTLLQFVMVHPIVLMDPTKVRFNLLGQPNSMESWFKIYPARHAGRDGKGGFPPGPGFS